MYRQTKSSKRSERVKEACNAIDGHLAELADQMRQGKSDALICYLEFTAQFHQYSFRNIMLAFSQRSNLTRLAGLRQWNKLGRRVRAGEKGIMILAPMSVRKKDAGESEEETEATAVTFFRPVHVFDVSQTEGDPLPSLVHSTGDVEAIVPALEKAVCDSNITLEFVEGIPGNLGVCGASFGGRIMVRSDLGTSEIFRTLAHEFAHEKLHWVGQKEDKTVRETEADATAYVVCRHFGVKTDTSDYLLLYDATPKVLLERLETIRNTADSIIRAIGNHLAEQTKTEQLCGVMEGGGHE